MYSLCPHGLPLAPQGPVFQGLQVYPEMSQREKSMEQQHICTTRTVNVVRQVSNCMMAPCWE